MKRVFQVGDRVTIPLGARRVEGTIVEDRGPFGVNRRRLYRVEVPQDPFDPTNHELPEDEIEVSQRVNGDVALSRKAIIDYLKYGGLIAILRSNLTGGKNQPRVWLCFDSLGNVTHTFTKDRGLAGGESVPFSAVHDNHVFTPKRDEILDYLQGFGLSKTDATEIIATVGSLP